MPDKPSEDFSDFAVNENHEITWKGMLLLEYVVEKQGVYRTVDTNLEAVIQEPNHYYNEDSIYYFVRDANGEETHLPDD